MASNLPIERIVSDYLDGCIEIIQSKDCTWCKKGQWRVVLILAVPKEGDETGFSVKCAVQCKDCLALESKEWNFKPEKHEPVYKSIKVKP